MFHRFAKIRVGAVGGALLVSTVVAAGGCGSAFDSDDCAESRTCAASGGGGGGGGNAESTQAGQSSDQVPLAGNSSGGSGGETGTDQTGGVGGDVSEPVCESGLKACAGECVDANADSDNCGACDNACGTGSICLRAVCKRCPAKNIGCDGQCVDPATDITFCGASGDCRGENRGATCTESEICGDGVCLSEDANLDSLSLDPAPLSPDFSPDHLSYKASFSYFEPFMRLRASPSAGDSTMSYADVAFTADDSVEVDLPYSEALLPAVSVEVTAPSGKTQTYEIALERAALGTTYVKPFNTRAGFGFGSSVAIAGDTAVFGAPSENSYFGGIDGNDTMAGTASGAAYVATRTANGKWARQAFIKADSAAEGAKFGTSVAVDGDTIAIGAPGVAPEGAVFVFARSGTTWSQQAKLLPPKAGVDTEFGTRVAVQGDRLIVSPSSSEAVAYLGGAAYAYTRTGSTWKADSNHPIPAKSHFSSYDLYGYRLSLSGDRVAVSEYQGESSVFVMLHGASGWSLESAVSLPSGVLAQAEVSLDGDTLAATAPGVVHIFTRSGASWAKETSLTPFDQAANDGFAASVALHGNLLVVGSSCTGCVGGISTFVRTSQGWSDGAFIKAKDLVAGDAQGAAVAVSGTRIAMGSPLEDSNAKSFNQNSANNSALDSGAAFIFE